MSYETRLKPFHVLGRRLDMWFTGKSDQESQKEALFSDLMSECKLANPGARLSYPLRRRLEPFPREVRKEIASGVKDGCAPLFIACKRGHVEIVQYLITVCNVDLEQRGLYEVPDDRSVHLVTPLWCAAVSGKLPVIKCLVEHGADVNATSDTGSTPVRSACFMTHLDIVAYLLENGADVLRANHNGGTCLINSVQSVQLCLCLLQHGASVNSCDIQNKTALHYAIQEHRFETTKLLLEHGADPHIRSRYNDDALQTACIKGASQIFNYLITNISYPPEQLANAHELIGSTFLDEHNDTATAMSHWYIATQIRLSFGSPENVSLPKKPVVPQRAAFRNSVEFKTMEELSNVSLNVDAMRMQSLLICERLLGANHKDTLFRLMYRGASYADALRYQRCIDLWRRALEIRVEKDTILYNDTCFTAQALVRLYVDLNEKNLDMVEMAGRAETEPRFSDVAATFELLAGQIVDVRHLLEVRPVQKRQQESFDRTLKCIAHLIYLLVETAHTQSQREEVHHMVSKLIRHNVRSASTGDTLLHLCVSCLNTIKSSYFTDENQLIFPNLDVIRLLLECGARVNARNESRSTPLHIAGTPYNFHTDLVQLLLDYGAHIDQPNKSGECPGSLIARNPLNTINLMDHVSLRCLAATSVCKYKIPYKGQIPVTLEAFVRFHE
ncbi:unnamed protein product [Timema podura]|uniref:Uncharacterized protein n=2 Tax=Timema TaxID=61471 RepID=A0A7R9K5V1_TIMGE|nr:unnamed protein product [Timema genevievae]CAG2058844.1 unnamed protein product [Timema podura]